MKKLGVALLFLLIPLAKCAAEGGTFIQPSRPAASGGGGGGSPAFQVVASTTDGTTVTSATATMTTTAATTKVLALIAWRRNGGQNINECRFNGVPMTDSEATGGVATGHNTAIYYANNPGAVTNGNLTCTMSASVPGLGISGMGFTGATVITSTGSSGASVTTSSATATANANNILVQVMAKQDPTTSNPTLNTAGASLKIDYTFSATGNGAFYKAAILTCASGSNTINYSWTAAARAAHSWLVLQP